MAEGVDLGKKLGPLPLGVWLVVVGGGLALGFFINKRQNDSKGPEPEQLTESGVGRGGSGFDVVTPPPTPAPEPVEETNQAWGRKVANWLVAQGYDAGTADNAVRKYLFSQNLTFAEQALINLALVRFGLPPEPLAPVEVPKPPDLVPEVQQPVSNLRVTGTTQDTISLAWNASPGATAYRIRAPHDGGHSVIPGTSFTRIDLDPGRDYTFVVSAISGTKESTTVSVTGRTQNAVNNPPPAPPPPPPPAARYYTIRSGDTLWGIAMSYYGNGNDYGRIYNANAGTIENEARRRGYSSSSGGHWIFPGTVLVIP